LCNPLIYKGKISKFECNRKNSECNECNYLIYKDFFGKVAKWASFPVFAVSPRLRPTPLLLPSTCNPNAFAVCSASASERMRVSPSKFFSNFFQKPVDTANPLKHNALTPQTPPLLQNFFKNLLTLPFPSSTMHSHRKRLPPPTG
jgi:hypothetical protein